MLVVARHSRPPLLVALFAIHAATIAAFFVTDRYRLWMTPIAALHAGGGVAALVAAFRTAPLRVRVGEIALLAALGFLCNLNPALFDPTARAEDRARDRGGLFRPAPDYVDLRAQHNNLAARLRESGDAAAALVECEAGLALAPDDPTLHLNLALTLEQLGTELYRKEQYAQARPLLERWTGEAPRNPEAWNTLGATLLKLDEPAAGIDAIRRATTLAPNERRYRYNLGLALVRTKHFDEGATVLDAILATDPDNAGALLARAEADVERGDFAAARPRLLRVLARSPKNARAADLLRRSGG
jgi:Flp pilus assembly protein TadD